MKILTLIIAVSISIFSYSQTISNINFDKIKSETTDTFSTNFYSLLLQRHIKADTNLIFEEINNIYYGSVFQPNYSPYGRSDSEDDFYKYYKQKKYKKATKYGLKILEENPIDLTMLFKMLVCYNEMGNKEKAELYAFRYFSLLSCIYHSGDGKSIYNSFVVVSVSDAYEILADLQLYSVGQSLQGSTDVIKLDLKSQKSETKIEELYFNVSMPLNHLSKMFNEETKE